MTTTKTPARRTRALRWMGAFVILVVALALATLKHRGAVEAATVLAETAIPPRARSLAAYQLATWASPKAHETGVAEMRRENPEWDLMARTFFALALADMALRSPGETDQLLDALDRVIDETLAVERARGQATFFLHPNHKQRFLSPGGRSLFVDGEIALMLGVRQIVRPREDYRRLLRRRVRSLAQSMVESPTLSGESYADECWTFCNTTALAALRVSDALEGESHTALFRDWVTLAKERLVDPVSGVLVSAYTYRGVPIQGPEGSTIWMSARNLLLVDDAFARDQYARAYNTLGGSFLGFGYAREWPRSWPGDTDIDSGTLFPLLAASPASSGFAVLGSAAFGDTPYLGRLLASLDLTALPEERDGALHFAASNAVGDAVILSGLVFGPVWSRVRAVGASVPSVTVARPL